MSPVLFSIVIACYKQEEFVREAIESALNQSFPSKEIIVVDDASPDGTAAVIDTFGDSVIAAKLKVNGGACAGRNHGASLARGQYIVFLDGDDVLMPWALEVYARIIATRSPKLIMGQCVQFSGRLPDASTEKHSSEIQFVDYEDFLAKDRRWLYNSSSLIVERQTFLASGGWTPSIFYQDIQDLMNKLAVVGPTTLILEPNTVWYRMHNTNAVRKVSPFVSGIYVLLAKEKAGQYPGTSKDRIRRFAWFGGLILYWMKESFRAGHYKDGFLLLVTKWWMILLAVARRGAAWLKGRKSVETLPVGHSL